VDLTGISAKWDEAMGQLQQAVAAADPGPAVAAALDSAAEQVSAQTAALRAGIGSSPSVLG